MVHGLTWSNVYVSWTVDIAIFWGSDACFCIHIFLGIHHPPVQHIWCWQVVEWDDLCLQEGWFCLYFCFCQLLKETSLIQGYYIVSMPEWTILDIHYSLIIVFRYIRNVGPWFPLFSFGGLFFSVSVIRAHILHPKNKRSYKGLTH